jgi:TfoX/Sxy family transcriptional regulator of competence genes
VAKAYLERLSALVGGAVPRTARGVQLQCKHFFSGAALYANGKICASLTPVGLAVKLPERSRTRLVRTRRARPLRYFPAGPIKKEYVALSRAILDNPLQVRRWLTGSIAYVTGHSVPMKKLRSR